MVKTTISEEKNILAEHSSVLDIVEEKISNLKMYKKKLSKMKHRAKNKQTTKQKEAGKEMHRASLDCGEILNSLQYV